MSALHNVSALATVALALAILAFAVQLIVFVAQYNLASEQGRRSEELYGSIQTVLAEIKEKAAITQADVRRLDDKMLEGLLSKQAADPGASKLSPGELIDEATMPKAGGGALSGELLNLVSSGGGVRSSSTRVVPWPKRRPDPMNDDRLRELLETFPAADEVGDTLDILKSLSDEERMNLRAFGDDEIIMRRPGSEFEPSLTDAAASGSEEKRLVEPYPDDRQPQGEPVRFMHLTNRGRGVARLLSAKGNAPDHLPGLEEIRSSTPERLPGYQAAARQ